MNSLLQGTVNSDKKFVIPIRHNASKIRAVVDQFSNRSTFVLSPRRSVAFAVWIVRRDAIA